MMRLHKISKNCVLLKSQKLEVDTSLEDWSAFIVSLVESGVRMFQEGLEGDSEVRVLELLTQLVSELLDAVLFKLAIQLLLPPLRHAKHVVRTNLPGVLPVVLGTLKDVLAHEVDSLCVLHHCITLISLVCRR